MLPSIDFKKFSKKRFDLQLIRDSVTESSKTQLVQCIKYVVNVTIALFILM